MTSAPTSELDSIHDDPRFIKAIELIRSNDSDYRINGRTGSFGVTLTIENGKIIDVTSSTTEEIRNDEASAAPSPGDQSQ